jgi:parallel beta-helix repeat protein
MAASCRLARCALLTLVAAGLAVAPAAAQFVLKNDMTGGDCETSGFGVWKPSTKTCELVADVQGTFELAADGLVLDGGGHTLTPRPGDVTGVSSNGRNGTTTRNLFVRGFGVGVHLQGGSGHKIVEVTAAGGVAGPPIPCGALLESTDDNEVTRSTFDNNAANGLCLVNAARNRIHDNRLRANGETGLQLQSSRENLIAANKVVGAAGLMSTGIYLFVSKQNLIADNAVADHHMYAIWLSNADENRIIYNVLTGNIGGGMVIGSSNDTRVACNDSTGSGLGVDIDPFAARTLVWMNNFYDTDTARDAGGVAAGNRFDLPAPWGGNHWTVNAPFCADLNADGFCDVPYLFLGNQDNLPWIRPILWRLIPGLCLGPSSPPPPEPPPQVDATARR